ncbi:MAG TPA: glycine cleavage T C-terminal barrel domain-containing protein [Terriglobales bacterium]|jgi:folate-binding protein YgfZ|nr:glycine cleavage T C-terminal barrel domain-containing protein [Terriglobales bacterium]
MSSTTSTEKLASLGLRRGEYAGAETALVFSDAASEFAALRSGCGVYDLSWRRHFLISGRDRVRWLNGMVSNSVRDLAAGHGVYAFVLNPQGHIVGDLYIYNRGHDFVLETDAAQAEKLYSHLKRFIIMDQVEFKAAEELTGLGLQGPKAEETLRRAGVEVPLLQPLQSADVQCGSVQATLVRGDHPLSPNYELWVTPAQATVLWDALLRAGATPVGAEAVELARIAAGIPRHGQDIRERDLPQETGQMRGLSFTKGCYIGQEIVERIRARGKLHRGFTGFRIVEGPLPATGSKVQLGGKDVGEVTSTAMLPAREKEIAVALGYIRTEAGAPGTVVELGATKAQVESLPFTF